MAYEITTPPSGLREALDWAATHATGKPRDPILTAPDGSGRSWLYDDTTQSWEEQPIFHKTDREVSNVDSFADLVIEIVRRRTAGSLPPEGDGGSVIFHADGAIYRPDDNDVRFNHRYKRKLSPQWELLVALAGKGLEHLAFVRALQSLRPSIPGYARVIQDFRKVDFTTNSSLSSQPFLEEGKAGMAYSFQLEAKGGITSTFLPSKIDFELQFARGGSKRYALSLEIDVTVAQDGDKKKPVFTLVFPDRAAYEEQAIQDEIDLFEEVIGPSCPKLLVLRNI